MDEPEAPGNDLRVRAQDKGAAIFARGDGIAEGGGAVFFCCANGGANLFGHVFRYLPSPYEGTAREQFDPGKLELFIESDDRGLLNKSDNCVVAPWGDLIIAEDADTPYAARGRNGRFSPPPAFLGCEYKREAMLMEAPGFFLQCQSLISNKRTYKHHSSSSLSAIREVYGSINSGAEVGTGFTTTRKKTCEPIRGLLLAMEN